MEEEIENLSIKRRGHEDYIKAIYKLSIMNQRERVTNSEISSYLKVTPPSVTEMLHKLAKMRLINWKPRKSILLTEKGKTLAKHLSDNYDMLFNFFIKILKLKDSKKVHEMCCKLEHIFDSSVAVALSQFILNYK